MEWQPIDTAPQDGSWVLLRGGAPDRYWDGKSVPPAVVGQFDGGAWRFAWYDSGEYGRYLNPTEWSALS